jgi:uracil DNA glycosylase
LEKLLRITVKKNEWRTVSHEHIGWNSIAEAIMPSVTAQRKEELLLSLLAMKLKPHNQLLIISLSTLSVVCTV